MIRKAKIKDIKAIHGLLQEYGNKGQLLPRPLSKLYDHLRDFSVFVNDSDDSVIGCCALQICWEGLAEIRSLAVHSLHQGRKIGAKLTEAALEEAAAFEINKIFTLTYHPEFFKKYGFYQIDISQLPLKIWGDCLLCVKFPDCDEIAMIKEMT